ncbi:MAG: 4Fe-4S binding protein [Clostridia bacterium]|nr:4Fe-4S binding protein [Clostridia bacterium]
MKKIAYQAFLGSNYGTILQSFALYHTIVELGYECEVVGCDEFRNRQMIDPKMVDLNSKKYDTLRTHLTYEQFVSRWFRFNSSLGKIPGNCHLNPEQQEEVLKFDAFICGSDQIWKPSEFWFCAKRYLQYAPSNKRIGYAPSIGTNLIEIDNVKNIPLWRKWLSEMAIISCREKTGSQIIENIVKRDVATVLDPTLLLKPKSWEQLLPYGVMSDEINKILISNKPYILAYLLDTYDIYYNYIDELGTRLNMNIIWLTGRDSWGPIQRNSATTDPAGFINLIKNASYICADGFHGICFAINFSKPFSIMLNERISNIDRVKDLCARLEIPDRVVYPASKATDLEVELPYITIQNNLLIEKEFSLKFLTDALKETSDVAPMPVQPIKSIINLSKPKSVRIFNSVPLDDPDNCTGCAACMNMCPMNAIEMIPSNYGFLRPKVDRDICIECGKCLHNCPLRKKPRLYLRDRLTKAWAVWSTNPFTISRCSSGGMFALMAKWMFDQKGVVYGVAWDDDLVPIFKLAKNENELAPLFGSKYVQANVGYVYQDVRRNLDAGIPVLFSGTGCQIAGLYAYLKGDQELLITTDLICGGTPAQSVFKKYLKWREKQIGSKIVHIEFRSKKKSGWGLGCVLTFANGQVFEFPWWKDEYGILYNQHFIQNTACYVCRFRGIDKRWSDITIGDFWGIGKQGVPFEYPTKQGVSVVLPNSIKGRALLSTIITNTSEAISFERDISEVFPGNAWLKGNYKKRGDYDKLAELLYQENFEDAFDDFFCSPNLREHLLFNKKA